MHQHLATFMFVLFYSLSVFFFHGVFSHTYFLNIPTQITKIILEKWQLFCHLCHTKSERSNQESVWIGLHLVVEM